MNAPEPVQRIASMADAVGASSCFGVATVAGDRVMVPVADVVLGFGFGWGGRVEPSGGGARSRGVAVIDVAPDGVRVHPIHDETAVTLARLAVCVAAVAMLGRVLLGLSRGR